MVRIITHTARYSIHETHETHKTHETHETHKTHKIRSTHCVHTTHTTHTTHILVAVNVGTNSTISSHTPCLLISTSQTLLPQPLCCFFQVTTSGCQCLCVWGGGGGGWSVCVCRQGTTYTRAWKQQRVCVYVCVCMYVCVCGKCLGEKQREL